jgi:hydrogenase maturation factor
VELLPGGLARVEAGGIIEEISVELIDAEAGGLVLVHAGVAIGKL